MSRRGWLSSGAMVLLLAFAGRQVDWTATMSTVKGAALIPLVAAGALNLLSLVLRGVRWWIFLRGIGSFSLGVAIQGAMIAAGFNNLMVANGGEAARVVLVSRAAGTSRTAIAATVALDRLLDPFCFAAVLVAAGFAIPIPPRLAAARPLIAVLLVLAVASLVLLARTQPARDAAEMRGWRRALYALQAQFRSLATGRRLTGAALCSVGVWIFQAATFALVARATGVSLPLAGSIAAMLLTDLGSVMYATPGNVGFFQLAYAAAAARFGVPADAGVATALVLQMLQMLPVTVLACVLAPGMLARRPVAACQALAA